MIGFDLGPASDDLFRVILARGTVEDCERFFSDLGTLSELRALTERWQVVRKLEEGMPCRALSEETGVSTAPSRAWRTGSGRGKAATASHSNGWVERNRHAGPSPTGTSSVGRA